MKYRIRLLERQSQGVSCPLPLVKLRVYDRSDTLAELDFRVDTGADVTSIPIALAARARQEGSAFRTDAPGRAGGIAGDVASYRHDVWLLIGGREHVWPCLFVDS